MADDISVDARTHAFAAAQLLAQVSESLEFDVDEASPTLLAALAHAHATTALALQQTSRAAPPAPPVDVDHLAAALWNESQAAGFSTSSSDQVAGWIREYFSADAMAKRGGRG